MKNLKDIITEKLKLDKHIKVNTTYIAGGEYSFEEFKKLVSSELQIKELIDDSVFTDLARWIDGMEKLQNAKFIDLTENKKEIQYYESQISRLNKIELKKYYGIKVNHPNGLFINYINLEIIDKSFVEQYRIGYVVGDDVKDISKTRIFKIVL